jgi:hypothetical protein
MEILISILGSQIIISYGSYAFDVVYTNYGIIVTLGMHHAWYTP